MLFLQATTYSQYSNEALFVPEYQRSLFMVFKFIAAITSPLNPDQVWIFFRLSFVAA